MNSRTCRRNLCGDNIKNQNKTERHFRGLSGSLFPLKKFIQFIPLQIFTDVLVPHMQEISPLLIYFPKQIGLNS